MLTSTTPHGTIICDEFQRMLRLGVQHLEHAANLPILAYKKEILPDGRKQGKNPIHSHRAGDYDSKCLNMGDEMVSSSHWQRKIEHDQLNLNLLLSTLLILDADSEEAKAFVDDVLAAQFPDDFRSCPIQSTAHGRHYFFMRPVECDHYNSAKCYCRTSQDALEWVSATAERRRELRLDLDCITVTSTGTRGNINVWPSIGKQWLRKLGDGDDEFMPQVLSPALYEYLDRLFIGKRAMPAPGRSHHRVPPQRAPLDHTTTNLPSGRTTAPATAKQQVYTDFICRMSKGPAGGPSVMPQAITWTSGQCARITTSRCNGSKRICMADAQHTSDGDNAMLTICDDGDLLYYCFSGACGKSRQAVRFPLKDVIQVGNADHMRAHPGAAVTATLKNLQDAVPLFHMVMEKFTHNHGAWHDSDTAQLALECVRQLGGGSLVRDENSLTTYQFQPDKHVYIELPGDAGEALYMAFEGVKAILHNLMERLPKLFASIVESLKMETLAAESLMQTAMGKLSCLQKVKPGSRNAIQKQQELVTMWIKLHDKTMVPLTAAEKKLPNTDELYIALKKAYDALGNKGPAQLIKTHLLPRITRPLKLNDNPHLMAFTNGVLELNTGVFRDGTPDDLLTINAPYDYSGSADDVPADVTCFLEQVFPVREEREFVRLWFAYCLHGKAPCKMLAIHSDKSDGYNSKSTTNSLFCAAMGDGGYGDGYAMSSTDNRLLQGSKNSDPNSHSDAERQFKDKRMAFIDEGSKRSIDFKALTNGNNTKRTARACGRATGRGDVFLDTAKYNLACNENDVPLFNTDDGAEARRLVFIFYRSNFVSDPEAWREAHPGHPTPQYVFKEDSSMVDRMRQPVNLAGLVNWLLPAYETLASRPEGMLISPETDVPESLRVFKAETLCEQAAPRELLEIMQDHLDDCWVHVGINEEQSLSGNKAYPIHEHVISFQAFTRSLTSTHASIEGSTSLSSSEFKAKLKTCFKELPGYICEWKRSANAPAKGASRVKNSLTGYKPRGGFVEMATRDGIQSDPIYPTLGESRVGQKRIRAEAAL